MPYPAPRLCANGCGSTVVHGHCPKCYKAKDNRRMSSQERGYGTTWWRRFRLRFIGELVAKGITPACGAALPDGPLTADSACKRDDLLTFQSTDGSSLHVDHQPALRDDELGKPHAMCDLRRVQLLCASCHARKSDPGRGTIPRWLV